MTAHTSVHEEHAHRVHRLFQLGWPSFWLLGVILAGMLALVAMVFLGFISGGF